MTLRPVLAANSLASLRHFVESGLGIAFMSGLSIGQGLVGRRTANTILNNETASHDSTALRIPEGADL